MGRNCETFVRRSKKTDCVILQRAQMASSAPMPIIRRSRGTQVSTRQLPQSHKLVLRRRLPESQTSSLASRSWACLPSTLMAQSMGMITLLFARMTLFSRSPIQMKMQTGVVCAWCVGHRCHTPTMSLACNRRAGTQLTSCRQQSCQQSPLNQSNAFDDQQCTTQRPRPTYLLRPFGMRGWFDGGHQNEQLSASGRILQASYKQKTEEVD